MSFEKSLNHDDLTVLWAAMAAMVVDVHAPQDNLTEDKWAAAETLWKRLDAEVNRRATASRLADDLAAVLANSPRNPLVEVAPGSITLDDDGSLLCVWPEPDSEGATCSYGDGGPMWAAGSGHAEDVVVVRSGGLTTEQCRWLMTVTATGNFAEDYGLVRRKLAHLDAGGSIENFTP